ncbi:hypothetical protein TCAL_06179 [Tigriopus californicus]|uniref:Phospholipase A2 n=1 Tax=Tigriopus californicus TaxID=6832 RepID=A0A553PLE1_TIGCA|nr:basic phospholipase A2 acanthin-1-like [Tigriopus californicus]TRY78493.1 hypothetical protein TCAL_06179 [Tigriopus californicus]
MKSFLPILLYLVQTDPGSTNPRFKRSVGQFGDMIRYATGREALLYNEYGNHCGFQGAQELPFVDEVDRCCYDHDRCYERLRQDQCSSSWLGPGWVFYDWEWDNTRIYCRDEETSCDFHACLCDKVAAQCFAQNPWNQTNKRGSGYDRFADLRWNAFKVFGTWFP